MADYARLEHFKLRVLFPLYLFEIVSKFLIHMLYVVPSAFNPSSGGQYKGVQILVRAHCTLGMVQNENVHCLLSIFQPEPQSLNGFEDRWRSKYPGASAIMARAKSADVME